MTGEKRQELISIIIPAYNEEKRIEQTLRDLYPLFSDIPHEILVVTDGCTDSTPAILTALSGDYPSVRAVPHPVKLGKGGGILLGISKSCGSVIAIVDADGAVTPHCVRQLVDMISEDVDCVISSRYLPGSVIPTPQPVYRVFASRCFNVLVRVLFNLPFRDTQCGCKVIKAEAADEVAKEIKTYNFAFDVDLLWRLKKHGFTIMEAPVEWHHKADSKVDTKKVIIQMFIAVVKMRFGR